MQNVKKAIDALTAYKKSNNSGCEAQEQFHASPHPVHRVQLGSTISYDLPSVLECSVVLTIIVELADTNIY